MSTVASKPTRPYECSDDTLIAMLDRLRNFWGMKIAVGDFNYRLTERVIGYIETGYEEERINPVDWLVENNSLNEESIKLVRAVAMDYQDYQMLVVEQPGVKAINERLDQLT